MCQLRKGGRYRDWLPLQKRGGVVSKTRIKLSGSPHQWFIILYSGNYRLHRGESLFVISELKYIQNCLPLKEYVSNGDKISDSLANTRSISISTQK